MTETLKGFFKVPFMVFLATIWVQNHKWLKPPISCLIHCIPRTKMANDLISRQRWSCPWQGLPVYLCSRTDDNTLILADESQM